MLCRMLTIQEVTACVCQATANKLVSKDSLHKLRCACNAAPSVVIWIYAMPWHAVLCMLCQIIDLMIACVQQESCQLQPAGKMQTASAVHYQITPARKSHLIPGQ